jgi:predicted dehydrogenase
MGTYVHGDKTRGDDSSTLILKLDGDVTAIAEESWAKPGGMDDRAEVYGSEGVAYADLLRGNAIQTYSQRGYGYAVEKATSTQGWSFTIYEEAWNYGFPY